MLKKVVIILTFMNIIFIFGCGSEIDEIKKENLFLKKQIEELTLEKKILNEQIDYIKNVYNIDVSDVNLHKKQSSGITKEVFGGD